MENNNLAQTENGTKNLQPQRPVESKVLVVVLDQLWIAEPDFQTKIFHKTWQTRQVGFWALKQVIIFQESEARISTTRAMVFYQ